MAEIKTAEFPQASLRAITDPGLQAALERAGGGFNTARLDAIDEMGSARWEEMREQAREIKRHTLDNLDYYLDLLTDRITRNGGHVHFARDATEANSVVTELARSRGVKLATKSKSMVSEEIGLNDALAEVEVEAVETDLGEYIIQLAEETPFHIVAPAMHKTRRQVSDLFSDKIGTPSMEAIEDMTEAARNALRARFLQADMGITGANFLVAETGTLVIITNEGNGRFCTSAPPVHVAITGMEKVIPSLEDLALFLRLLPRSATGQRLTSYVSMVSGPRRPEDADGPEEFHLVVVDNGRSRLLADPELREALYCIRCGACLNICPVYRKVGGHAYGWVYPGPIGAVVSPVLVGLPQARDLPNASSLCGACRDVCPIKINIPHMLLALRNRLAESQSPEERHTNFFERLSASAYASLMSSPRLLSAVRGLGRALQTPLVKAGMIRKAPFPPLSKWTRHRDLPPLAPKPFRKIWEENLSRGP